MSNKKIFVAGASGVIGRPLCRLLAEDGWKVYGTTRSQENVEMLKQIGIEPIIIDVFDGDKLNAILSEIKPEIVIHQLTDLPDGLNPDKMAEALVRNAKLRDEGTKNLVKASINACVKKIIVQSIAFIYEPKELPYTEESPLLNFDDPIYGQTSKAVSSMEEQVLNTNAIGVVLRNGLLYGPGTGFDAPVDFLPSVHVEAAAYAAFLAISCKTNAVYNVSDNDARLTTTKIKNDLGWTPDLRVY